MFENAICMQLDIKPSKGTQVFLKSKLNQKPQFLSTLLANFWYFAISGHSFYGNLSNFGPSPPQKTFRVLDHCVSST